FPTRRSTDLNERIQATLRSTCKFCNQRCAFRTCEKDRLAAKGSGLSGILSQNFPGPDGNVRVFFCPNSRPLQFSAAPSARPPVCNPGSAILAVVPTGNESETAMAEAAEAVIEKGTVRLQVAAARQEESGRGVARMPRSAFQALGITEGDPIEIEGKRVTAATAFQAYDEDEALQVVRLDGLLRANADTSSGEHVTIRRAESRPATRVVFAPAQREMRLQGPGEALKRVFFRRPLVAGDLVATHGQQPVRNVPPDVRR